MVKYKSKISGSGPISRKVLSRLKKENNKKIVDFSDLKDASLYADSLEKTVISEKELLKYDPIHGIYIYAQNKISILVEQLGELQPLSKLSNAYADADDLYMPSGPPISPLTKSYFTCWGFFDLCAGIKKESFGTVVIDLCKALGVDKSWIKIFEHMQNSRMGFYIHEGFVGRFVFLRELITQKRFKVIVPSGYLGDPGQIWFIRILPEPFPELNYGYSVVFTTPYVLSEMKNGKFLSSTEKNWVSFFERNLKKIKTDDKNQAYEILMKYGLNRHYWNEFIFEGYVNFKQEMILLAGFPDIPLSRPHSKESQEIMSGAKMNALIENEEDEELEDFIEDWHWDKKSHEFARQAGRFLFQFIDYLEETGLSERTIRKHIDNCWSIGILECQYGYHDKFSPDIFVTEPSYLYEFKRKHSDSKYAVDSYKATWRKLAKYAKLLEC